MDDVQEVQVSRDESMEGRGRRRREHVVEAGMPKATAAYMEQSYLTVRPCKLTKEPLIYSSFSGFPPARE